MPTPAPDTRSHTFPGMSYACGECHGPLLCNSDLGIAPCSSCRATALAERTEDIAAGVGGTPTFTGSLPWRFRLRCMLTPDHAIRRTVDTTVLAIASAIRKSSPAEEVSRAQE